MAEPRRASYLGAVRGDLPILYRESERFPFGGYKVVRRAESDRPAIVLAGTGYLVHSCLKAAEALQPLGIAATDRKSTRLNSSHANISYAVFCLEKKDK